MAQRHAELSEGDTAPFPARCAERDYAGVPPAVSSFFIPKLLGGGQYVLVGNVIETQFLTSGDWNFGSAISLIMAVIIMLSMWLTRKVDTDPAANGKGA